MSLLAVQIPKKPQNVTFSHLLRTTENSHETSPAEKSVIVEEDSEQSMISGFSDVTSEKGDKIQRLENKLEEARGQLELLQNNMKAEVEKAMEKRLKQINLMNLQQRKSFQNIILHRVLKNFRKSSSEVTMQFRREISKMVEENSKLLR